MNETVSEESTAASTVATNNVRQTRPVLSECKICGAPARYAYYGTVVCQSCKMFFKRNAEARSVKTKQNVIICLYLFISLGIIEMSFSR